VTQINKDIINDIELSLQCSFDENELYLSDKWICFDSKCGVYKLGSSSAGYVVTKNGIAVVDGFDGLSYLKAEIFRCKYPDKSYVREKTWYRKGFSGEFMDKFEYFYCECNSMQEYSFLIGYLDAKCHFKVSISSRESVNYGLFLDGTVWPKNFDQMDYIEDGEPIKLIHMERGRMETLCQYDSWQSLYLCRLNYWLNLL
jgi:hypothetical protein